MWIRSQDKEILIKAICIYLCGENHENCIRASCANGNKWYIGKYSTREKALKVLDEIQNYYRRLPQLIYDYQLGGVFQMPGDDFDEVEE
jgi:hypothetical protein